MVSQDQKSDVAPPNGHLGLANAMLLLTRSSVSHDAGTGSNGVT